ncbi:4-alpha-glucanotransferase [Streptosporangium jomthongense]|uniref:4-alpha-glucanotransferase n=1 Tax=Marinobacter aromaticivorans TaxID=1494078 RepID=A0ABW2IX00_9GAMM|nr:4-alpha-glucanotransferase [Marinobacter aromaticivorans]GGE73558.1 4-alpha-glucanotransferase [Streptosporangium jomthongense]
MTPAMGGDLFLQRRAGVLLHPTCLQGRWGVLGASARHFIDFLSRSGMQVWQTLPTGPTHDDLSPYQSLSAHAGNTNFIDLAELLPADLVTSDELSGVSGSQARRHIFDLASQRFFDGELTGQIELTHCEYDRFCKANDYWLNDFCLFCAIRESHPGTDWLEWPPELRERDPHALRDFADHHHAPLRRIRFEQYLFHHQWQKLREYARARNVLLFGDIPIFVAHNSADVWANRDLFKLDNEGRSTVVAGVPPDYFCSEGQHWGNPLYDWDAMARDGYQWWLERLGSQKQQFDLVRIDHFRGLQAYWEIPADRPEPRNGYWVPGPADAFLEACFRRFPGLPLVAENLGVISDDVEQLRQRFNLPGMTVIQFGFDGSPNNPHLLKNHQPRNLVYTGTHDNDTTLGWYLSLDEHMRHYVAQCLEHYGDDMPWPVIRAAFDSVSTLAIIPMQDLLALGTEARFNTPGTLTNNWVWQLDQMLLSAELATRIRDLLSFYRRLI